jgi:hypothetical protein
MPDEPPPLVTVQPPAGEPWGRRLWLALAAVVVVAAWLASRGIATWPMADDEVPSLVELGLLDIGAENLFSVPRHQIERLRKATVVWNVVQRTAIDLLPAGELSYRIPSLVFAVLMSAATFLLAARWRGLWFAFALAIVLHGSQPFIYLGQVNRFYIFPLLLLTLTIAAMWVPRGRITMIVATGLLAALCILSHNVTLAVFALAFAASCVTYVLGQTPARVVVRSGAAAVTGGLIYLFYLRPLVQGWVSTDNRTNVLVSFTAHAGVPAMALALLGGWLAARRAASTPMIWWALVFVGGLILLATANLTWNPRYFLFFLPAAWVLAAHAMAFIAERAGAGLTGVVWYAAVALMLAPGLVSHFQDGSRHDYREAAAYLVKHARPSQPILSDDAETLAYYLPADLRAGLQVRTRVTEYPQSEFFVVFRTNSWWFFPRDGLESRKVETIALIQTRRYDQFSHVLYVHHVSAAP